jgi:hypothetical protein
MKIIISFLLPALVMTGCAEISSHRVQPDPEMRGVHSIPASGQVIVHEIETSITFVDFLKKLPVGSIDDVCFNADLSVYKMAHVKIPVGIVPVGSKFRTSFLSSSGDFVFVSDWEPASERNSGVYQSVLTVPVSTVKATTEIFPPTPQGTD